MKMEKLHRQSVCMFSFVLFLLLPSYVSATPRIDLEKSDKGWNGTWYLSSNSTRVKRQISLTEFRCSTGILECGADGSCMGNADLCNEQKDCSSGKDEENCAEWSQYFTLRRWKRVRIETGHRWSSLTFKACVKLCLEKYGCLAIAYNRKQRRCRYYFDVYMDLIFDPDYDFYRLKNLAGPVVCEADEYRCSPGQCVWVGWLCDGDKDCNNGRDEEGCSLMRNILNKTPGQTISPAWTVETGVSLEGCAKLCTEQDKRCSFFSYETKDEVCGLGCTECGYQVRTSAAPSTDLYTLVPPKDVRFTNLLVNHFRKIGRMLPVRDCSVIPEYGSYRTSGSSLLLLPSSGRSARSLWTGEHALRKRELFRDNDCDTVFQCEPTLCYYTNHICNGNSDCPTGKDEHKCDASTLCHFLQQRGRILNTQSAIIRTFTSIVGCAKFCLEEDGCRGFAHNGPGSICYIYYDMDIASLEDTNYDLYTLRGHGSDICKKGEYQCSAGQCVTLNLVCDGQEDCNNGRDEGKCDVITRYRKVVGIRVLTKDEDKRERGIWKMASAETCAKLCQEEVPHCKFYSYFQSTQLCVLGCPPESECGKKNILIQDENSTLYYRADTAEQDDDIRELATSSNTKCKSVQYYGTYQSEPYFPINFTSLTTPSLDRKSGPCAYNVSECAPSLCFRHQRLCDGDVDCPTGKDEHKCDTSLCFFSVTIGRKFIDPNTRRFSQINLKGCAKICLETDGCLGFAHSDKGALICWFYFNLQEQEIEDSNYDLYILKNAKSDICPANTFKCSHVQCIPRASVCDGKEDCNNGKDEYSCSSTTSTTTSSPQVFTQKTRPPRPETEIPITFFTRNITGPSTSNQPGQRPGSQAGDLPVSLDVCGQREVDFDPNVNQTFPRTRVTGSEDRVTGGVEVPYGAYPWQVQIMVSNGTTWRHLCGGTILSAFHILTAAHCMVRAAQTRYQIIVGQLNTQRVEEAEQSFGVQNIYLHDRYNRVTRVNDIALVRIRPVSGRVIEFSKYVQPACLPEPDIPYVPGVLCHVSGWGKVDAMAPDVPESSSPVLRAVVVPLVSDSFCQSYEVFQGRGITISDDMFCAGYIRGGPDSCQGDSGGPLACNIQGKYKVMGIVSFGVGCGNPLYPGVYVRVSRYTSWIYQHMQLISQ